MAQSRYYHPDYARRRAAPQSTDVERGLAAGKSIGEALGGLAGAIKDARANAAANQLMNAQAISAQPGAGVTQGLGTLPADASAAPADFAMPALSQAPTGPGTGTVGGLLNTGGTAEVKSREDAAKEALTTQNIQSLIAQRQAATALTGTRSQAATNLAQLRAGIAANQPPGGTQPQTGNSSAWSGYQVPGTTPRAPTGPRGKKGAAPEVPVVIGSEPVTDQSQLASHFDGTYGHGAFSRSMANIDTAKPTDDGNHVTIGPAGKEITIPTSDAQAYVKQMNTLRKKQGLSMFPVPGEDATLGTSAANPYPSKNNLDVYSRPSGSWVTLPNGKTAQVP